MVDLARQLKESSMLMNQSVQDTEKVDSSVALSLFLLCMEFPQLPVGCLLRMLTCLVLLMQILDSTERAVEHSLASTGRATARASEVYSLASKTTCFQWLLLFMMTCMFVMVVLLIRVTWCYRGHWRSVLSVALKMVQSCKQFVIWTQKWTCVSEWASLLSPHR